ncbi:MAG: NUDIX domain-containing protein [Gemmatimonadales bacterium]|nr:NUDIX domain-containing protein [Gemmatimonadales bacterium]
MPPLKHKVLAYITHRDRLLVFRHPDHPEAGIQVPGGTAAEGEDPAAAVLREATEETGLTSLRLATHLGDFEQSVPERCETWLRHCYHLVCEENPPQSWRSDEHTPSDGTPGPITFEFFWVKFPEEVPELAAGHEVMLPRLIDILRLAQGTNG